MKRIAAVLLSVSVFLVIACNHAETKETDVLKVYLTGGGLLTMSHNIDGFMAPTTVNTMPGSTKNINNMDYDALKGHLTTSAIAYIDGEVAGVVTETEIIYDFKSGNSDANSLWLVKLNKEGYRGYITVEQIEGPQYGKKAGLKEEVVTSKDGRKTKDTLFQMTRPGTRVQHASGDLAKYQGGIFIEYSVRNEEDPSRGGVLLEFYPAE